MLRDLPARRAPGSLESRVLRELERRIGLPWWRRGFAQWPLAARAAFVAVCIVVIGLSFLDGSWAITAARALIDLGSGPMRGNHPAIAAMASTFESAMLLLHVMPAPWLYSGLAVGALLYAALFGLGAAAYRTLYLQTYPSGQQS
jgi:hypothetical protein